MCKGGDLIDLKEKLHKSGNNIYVCMQECVKVWGVMSHFKKSLPGYGWESTAAAAAAEG